MPVLAHQCATCPFRDGAKPKYAQLRGVLTESIMSKASHICHSTGSRNAFHYRTGKQAAICRGARNVQLKILTATGFLSAPTDEAWNERCREMNLPEIPVIQKPIPTIKRTRK